MTDEWPLCGQCAGACIVGRDSCLAHAKRVDRADAFRQFSESGDLDVRGVTISDSLLKEIFDAAPHDTDSHPTFSCVRFDEATFEGDAKFDRAIFGGGTMFSRATFKGRASFEKASFEGEARFDEATFGGLAWFVQATFKRGASFWKASFEDDTRFDWAAFKGDAFALFSNTTFKGEASFGPVTFEGNAHFQKATFGDGAWFDDAIFEDEANFSNVTFKGIAHFWKATFGGEANFSDVTFEGEAGFWEATFGGEASFGDASFKGGVRFSRAGFKLRAQFTGARFDGDVPVLGPIAVEKRLDLDGVQFASAIRIDADANELTCRRSRFSNGVQFDVRRAVVRLDNSDLSAPSLLTGPAVSDPARITEQPKLLSLQGTNVAGLTLGNVRLADCRFAGAHNLDKLRLEAGTVFGFSPAVAGWERREVIAEEAAWRAAKSHPGRWKPPAWPDSEYDKPEVLSPGAIGGLYRTLRKGREDVKNEPGAADFYYGEMEMRRHDRGTGDTNKWRGRASRILLAAYWLVSGYGLRAWRSIVALVFVTAVFAALFRLWGFTNSISYWKSLLFAFRSTISLTDPSVKLTAWGGLFQALLRLTGPVLLALTLLALRGRVKR